MPTAHEVATELRKLANSLDRNPEAEIKTPSVFFGHWREEDKEQFLTVARILPRPLVKKVSSGNQPELRVCYETDAMRVQAYIPQSSTCTLVEPARPAKYRCEPILSEAEDAELEVL